MSRIKEAQQSGCRRRIRMRESLAVSLLACVHPEAECRCRISDCGPIAQSFRFQGRLDLRPLSDSLLERRECGVPGEFKIHMACPVGHGKEISIGCGEVIAQQPWMCCQTLL